MTGPGLRWTAPLALLLHAAVLGWLWPRASAPLPQGDPPPLEIEMIEQAEQDKGTPAVQATQATPAPPPQPAPSPEPPPGDVPVPAPNPPPPPPTPPSAPAEVNLGDAAEDVGSYKVSGDHVVPPRPDAKYRNIPPAYPVDAARRHAQGTVELLVHVAVDGTAEDVAVSRTSGTPSLDRAAADAVARWHFTPAVKNGETVAYDWAIDIHFTLGGR